MQVSLACIPEGIVRLFEATSLKTRVRIVHEPAKLAWVRDDVFLEVHATLDEMAQIEEKAILDRIRPEDLRPRIRKFAGEAQARIDWQLAYQTAAERRGSPIRITP